MAGRSEAKSAKGRFASKIQNSIYFDAKLRYAHPSLAKFNTTTIWSVYPERLRIKIISIFKRLIFLPRILSSSAAIPEGIWLSFDGLASALPIRPQTLPMY